MKYQNASPLVISDNSTNWEMSSDYNSSKCSWNFKKTERGQTKIRWGGQRWNVGFSEGHREKLEFDSLGTIALEGGTLAAVARSKEQWTWSRNAAVIQLVSEIVSEEKLGQREKWKHKVVDIGRLDDCLCGSWAEPTANNMIQCGKWMWNCVGQ